MNERFPTGGASHWYCPEHVTMIRVGARCPTCEEKMMKDSEKEHKRIPASDAPATSPERRK